jgi:hypothetical protein
MPNEPQPDEVQRRLQQAIALAEKLVAEVDQQSKRLTRAGRKNFLYDRWFRTVVALLSVASPTLVAFQSQAQSSGLSWVVVTAFVAVAGASTTLQSIWQFGRIAAQATLNGMQLDQISARLKAALAAATATTDTIKSFSDLNAKIDQLQTEYWSVMKSHFEGEASRIIEVEKAAQLGSGAPSAARSS